MCLGGSALIVSLVSLALNWKSRLDQQAAARLSKKTELLTKLVEAKAAFGHLAMIYAQKLMLIRERGGPEHEREAERVKSNLDLILEQSRNTDAQYNALRGEIPKDIPAWEDMLLTANSFIAHSKEELDKEQEAFNDLRRILE